MYGFDNDRFLSVMNGAVDNMDEIIRIADDVYNKGFENIFFIGTGGTYAIIQPLVYMFKTNSRIPYYYEIAAEFLCAKPKALTNKSLVITASLSGTTQETIDACVYCRNIGAKVIAFTSSKNTPLGEVVDYCVENDAENDNLVEELHLQFFTLGARLMKKNNEFPDYEMFIDTLKKMPSILLEVRSQNDERALKFAQKHKDTQFHLFVGAGNTFGETYCFAMCVLEEMQWIPTKSIHAAEYFHGEIELTNENMSFILIKGEDETRALVDRVENFVRKHTELVEVFDTKDYELNGVPKEMRKYISPMITSTQLERVSANFEKVRNHSLELRKFYRQVEY